MTHARSPKPLPCAVSHVAEPCRCYPGDDVTLHTLVRISDNVAGYTLRVSLDDSLEVDSTGAPSDAVPQVALGERSRTLIWKVETPVGSGFYEYRVATRIRPTPSDVTLRSRAALTVEAEDGECPSASETACIAVSAKGRYLRHLPALYQRDELMGRFLMLFESFWTPIERRIEHIPLYLDPRMAPAELLPWLASWLGLVLDERWSEEQRRLLLCSAASLYRRRGTREALREYLGIIGEEARIVEHRAHNFVLGGEGRLGPGIALGTDNVPHTFTVILTPPTMATDDPDAERRELERRRAVRAIIEAEKPAHAGYTLRVESDPPASRTEG